MLVLPTDPPELLFRRCLELPYPSIPTEVHLAGGPVTLHLRAMKGWEIIGADNRELIKNGFGFSQRTIDGLYEFELDALTRALFSSLSAFPIFGLCNWSGWVELLKTGGSHPSNALTQVMLTGAENPAAFFGIAPIHIADAHFIVWQACRPEPKE